VIAVFGCGGERDAAKRPEMGRIAGRIADVVLVTDDNPRGEDSEAIADAILAGLAGTPAAARRVAGRRAAIEEAVALARPQDAVLVAGKGHETYQETGGVRTPFDDREVLRAAIAATGACR
jgi:UDP-N-acetylmuramoyl-L-alanyl-D-glutamate--2,6-diaminopimelate ligase